MKIEKNITYNVSGMDLKTINFICLGLERLKEQSTFKNKEIQAIIDIFDSGLDKNFR